MATCGYSITEISSLVDLIKRMRFDNIRDAYMFITEIAYLLRDENSTLNFSEVVSHYTITRNKEFTYLKFYESIIDKYCIDYLALLSVGVYKAPLDPTEDQSKYYINLNSSGIKPKEV